MPKITIRVANAEKLETQFLPELASGGLFIRSDKFLPLGAEVDIDLYLPSATEALPLKGRVTKVVDDDDARARKATGMTLSVDATSEPTRSRLDALYTAYKIPVKRPGQREVPSNGAHGNAIPLPSPASLGAAIPLPAPPSHHGGSDAIPLPGGPGPSLASEDDLPSPRGAPPPSIAPAIPSIAPAIPSIAPAIPPATKHTTGSVPVMKFEKTNGTHGGKPTHDPFSQESDSGQATNPFRTLPNVEEPAPDLTPVKPLPFPFQRGQDQKPPEVPSFKALNPQRDAPAAVPPPPPPESVAVTPADGNNRLEVKLRELEAAEAKSREQAKRATAEKEALEAKHAEATKRLNDEIAALQRRPASGGKSPIPAALIGLVLGAGLTFVYFNFVAPPATTTTTTTTTTTGGNNTVAVVGTGNPANNNGNGTGSGTPDKPVDTTGTGNTGAVVAANAVADAGTKASDQVAAVVKPEEVAPAAKPDAGTTMLAQADVGGTKTDVKPEVKPEEKPTNPEKVAEVAPPLVEEKKPVVEEKKPVAVNPADEPIGENAGVLNLRADMPATVYVNGKKVGNAPALGIKANPGKVQVRFDCIVEDVRVRGKTRTLNLEPNGKASMTYSCIE